MPVVPAAFGRLCVETTTFVLRRYSEPSQPPSGGCVLKLPSLSRYIRLSVPAAFGRLCVETSILEQYRSSDEPAAFGRLCVETWLRTSLSLMYKPAAFGRLCVETPYVGMGKVRRPQPPSGGCVLKPPKRSERVNATLPQPPSGGCVLKLP